MFFAEGSEGREKPRGCIFMGITVQPKRSRRSGVITCAAPLQSTTILGARARIFPASIRGRMNVYKTIGERYIKVTYKKLSHETLIISVVDKA